MPFINIDSKCVWISKDNLYERLDFNFYSPSQLQNESKIKEFGRYKKLNDIVNKKRSEPQTVSNDFCEEGIDLIRMSDLSPFEIDFTNTAKIPENVYDKLKDFTLKEEMIIFGLTGVTLGRAVIVPKNIRRAITNRRIAQLEIKTQYDSYYVGTFLNTRYGQLQLFRYATGVAQPNLRLEDTGEVLVPIPSPEIQKYIGDKVRRAEELREEAKRLENEINTFFNEKFSDIYNSIDESKVYHSKFTWKSAENIRDVFNAEYFTLIGDKYEQVIREQKGVYLDDLLKDCFMGKSPSQYADKGPKILKVKNLTNGGLDWSDSDHVDKEFYVKNKRCHLQHGDVFIIPAAHLAKYIGEKVDVYIQGIEGIKYPDAMASGKIIVIRPNFDKVNPIYLCLVMREKFVYHQIQRQVSGITASYYPKDVRQLCIPLIEREKQDMVADKYIEIIKCKEQAKQLIQEAKQDVEDLIEGDFEMSELNNNSSTESRC